MPLISLLAVTSPIVAASLPETIAVEHGISRSAIVFADANSDAAAITLNPAWTLVATQEEGDPSQDQSEPTAEDASDEQPVEAEAGDSAGGEQDGGEIIVQGKIGPTENDLMSAMNEESFRLTQKFDGAFVEPVAKAYRDGLPGPLRDGLGNFVRNLGEPVNFVNFLLQLKIGKAFETLARFGINSTLGIGGIFDLADEPGIGLPYRRNGFANTLGYYGVGPGPYLNLPIAGSTSVRDLIGNTLDGLILPTIYNGTPLADPEVVIPVILVSTLQSRLDIDEQLERINASDDPYATTRDGYLAEREATIQEFRDGSPLQGIPDRERPDGLRLRPEANSPTAFPVDDPNAPAVEGDGTESLSDQTLVPDIQREFVLVEGSEPIPGR